MVKQVLYSLWYVVKVICNDIRLLLMFLLIAACILWMSHYTEKPKIFTNPDQLILLNKLERDKLENEILPD